MIKIECKCCKKASYSKARGRFYCSRECWGKSRKSIPMEERFWKKVVKTDSCWLWDGSFCSKGYGNISPGSRLQNKYAHRVSWEIHNGEIKKGLHVLHKCDTPACVNPSHLFLGTNLDNIKDRAEKKRSGPRPWLKELTFKKKISLGLQKFILCFKGSTSGVVLSKQLGLCYPIVYRIWNGQY